MQNNVSTFVIDKTRGLGLDKPLSESTCNECCHLALIYLPCSCALSSLRRYCCPSQAEQALASSLLALRTHPLHRAVKLNGKNVSSVVCNEVCRVGRELLYNSLQSHYPPGPPVAAQRDPGPARSLMRFAVQIELVAGSGVTRALCSCSLF